MASTDFAVPAAFPSPTSKWHNTTYQSIDAARPELSLKGKTVVLTGAGSGIGKETAKAFAAAGASHIHLLGGRRQARLSETKDFVTSFYKDVTVQTYAIDISDKAAVREAAKHVGSWDVTVLNAGYLPTPATILEADLDDWNKAWDINLKGNVQVLQVLLGSRNKDASVIGTSSCAFNVDVQWMADLAPYAASKIAFCKLFEIFAAGVPDCHFVTFHPGSVVTEMLDKANLNVAELPKDEASLPANFAVWLASQEARFLRGKFVWAMWDVDELKERAAEIKSNTWYLTTNLMGWPFGVDGNMLQPSST